MYSCEELNKLLMDYLEGTLDLAKTKDFDYHLSLCQNCVNYLKTYRKTLELTGVLKVDQMPAELKSILLKVITNAPRK